MTTTPDRILLDSLRQYQTGTELEVSLRHATLNEIKRLAVTPPPANRIWARWWSEVALGPRKTIPQKLDGYFEQIFRRVGASAWPTASSTAHLVSAFVARGHRPVHAVEAALRLEDRVRTCDALVRDWCRLGQSLYRPEQVLPFLNRIRHWEYATPLQALQWLSSWVYTNVTYKPDIEKWGKPDFWQSPEITLLTQSGDCEDMALVTWSAATLLGFSPGRLVVGAVEDQGHAWVEFPEEGLYAEATAGTAGWLALRTGYEPWLYIEPDRCVQVSVRPC